MLLSLVTTDFKSKKEKFDAYLLLLPLVIIFLKEKAKIFLIYKMNKSYISCLLKANTDLGIKLKMFTSNSCFCIIEFISKKVKNDIYLLLLLLITNFI